MGTYGQPGPSITFNMAEKVTKIKIPNSTPIDNIHLYNHDMAEVTKNEIPNSTTLIHIFPIFGHKRLERWARMVGQVLPLHSIWQKK